MLVSKRKRYLSGPDWVINTLDHMMKGVTCSGNMSQIVMLLNGPLEEGEARKRLGAFVCQFPVLEGSVARDFKLTPYWKIPLKHMDRLSLTAVRVPDIGSLSSLLPFLERSANSSFVDERDHIAFHLFSDSQRSALSMTFDHRIFDARGAESFLNLFQQSLDDGKLSGDITFTSSQELTEWMGKFLAGRSVNRRIIALSKSAPRSFPFPPGRDRGFRYRLISLDERQTKRLYECAYSEAGYLMESTFLLGCVIQSVHDLLKNAPGSGTSYLIPVSMDLRPGKELLQECFFNHVSYLFYQIPMAEADDSKRLLTILKQQMYEQVKSGFPKDLAQASLLTRIAPLPLLGKLLHIPLKGKMATFVFSHLGKSSYQSPEFMGRTIGNLFHMPRVPVPPGLGFFSNYFQGRLNLVISHLDGLLQDIELQKLEAGIRKRFGLEAA